MNFHLIYFLAVIFAALVVGSIARILSVRTSDEKTRTSRLNSLRTWWILFIVVSGTVLAGQIAVYILLLVAGVLGLREYLRLVGYPDVGLIPTCVVFALIPLHYVLLASGHVEFARSATPVLAVLFVCTARVLTGKTDGYIRTTAAVVWGFLLFGYNISHATIVTSSGDIPWVGHSGWFLFVLILTESNDISQALVGRRIGRRKITPTVSPNKSWEGFLAGVTVTTLSANLLAPWLTTFHDGSSSMQNILTVSIAGLLISIAGFIGDINMSAIKRDVGVKDGSTMLPGHGGIIDRIDSLTFTAPAFYYYVSIVS